MSQRHRNLKSGEYYLAERREIEAELEATGKAYVADAQGRVELPRFDAAWICARAGDRWLPDCWRTNSSAPVRLELEREVGLRIRVLDSHGVPTIDVPVAVEVEISPGVRAVHWRGTTHGPAGIAEVPWVTFRSSQHFGRRDVFATLGLAGASGSRTKIDVRRLPDAPVDLVMAPHGLVRVEVKDEHGRPFLDEAFVGVGVESDSGHWVVGQTDLIWQQARNGVVELDHVGLGLDLVAFLQVGDDERMPRLTSFHGPVQENELVSIVTTPGDPVPVLTGRLLGPRDEPVRDWTVRANYAITSQGTEERQQTTDEEGWFRLPLTREPWQYTKEWSEFAKNELTLTPDSPEALGAEFVARAATLKLTPEQLEPGVHDLGEIRLVEAPCIAAGVVVDAQGVAQSGLQVVLERHTRNAQTWTFDLNFNQFTGRDGSFRFSGRIEDSSVRATVRDLGWYVPNRVEIRPGTTDARVVVERTGSLRGRLLVDDGVPVDDLSLRLSDELVVPGSFMASPTERVHVANDGSFTIDAVRPAVGSVSVGLGSSALFEELVRVENVTVRGGEPTLDPQLAAVDLRGRLRVIEVHVVDRDGVAVPSAMLKFRPRGALDSTSARLARTDASGLARLTVSTSPTRTTVEHDGFDSTEVSDLASSREIVLTRKK